MSGRDALYRVDVEQDWEFDDQEIVLRFEQCRKPLWGYIGKVVRISLKGTVHSLDAAVLLRQITYCTEINPQYTFWLYTFRVAEVFSYEWDGEPVTITNEGDP